MNDDLVLFLAAFGMCLANFCLGWWSRGNAEKRRQEVGQ